MPGRRRKQSLPTTRVSVVVLDDEGNILLVRHRKGKKRHWVLPGGRLEHGESFEECARREMVEETGLEVKIDRFLYISEALAPDRSRHIVNIFVKATVIGGLLKCGEEKVLDAVDYIPVAKLETLKLFPPVGKQIIELARGAEPRGIKYLGNLWM
ncbi:MAG: NUDIX hydrolase [Candidatus Obscuribacterales bacterium]|nr:NUDIX hydrolase [Candidatus Obscuribacterales bacterium]